MNREQRRKRTLRRQAVCVGVGGCDRDRKNGFTLPVSSDDILAVRSGYSADHFSAAINCKQSLSSFYFSVSPADRSVITGKIKGFTAALYSAIMLLNGITFSLSTGGGENVRIGARCWAGSSTFSVFCSCFIKSQPSIPLTFTEQGDGLMP